MKLIFNGFEIADQKEIFQFDYILNNYRDCNIIINCNSRLSKPFLNTAFCEREIICYGNVLRENCSAS